jgi:hypothetical protein
MMLANVAWILASNGDRVLTIDWDLEAPGLHRYFQPFLKDKSLSATDGLMDAITEFVEAAVSLEIEAQVADVSTETTPPKEKPAAPASPENPDWYKSYANLLRYAVTLNYKFPGKGRLDLIGSGRQGPAYAAKVNLFDWEQFFVKFAGAAFLQAAKDFIQQKYEYVLIDSRTGVSDTSGICTMEMPDALVVCFTLNNQSIEGARAMTLAAQEYRSRSSLGPIATFPVPCRVEQYESDRVELGRELARVRFRQFVPPAPASEDQERYLQQYWGNVEVPYVPKYAYEEILACFGDQPHLKSSVLSSAEQIATLIRGETTELLPPSDEERAAVMQLFLRKPNIVTTAEEFVACLSPSDQESARRLFTRLVQASSTKGPSTPDVPWQASLGEMPEDALRLLDKAVAARLITTTGEGANPALNLSDTRLVSAWPRLTAWIDREREFLVWRQQFDQLFRTWEASNGDPDDLLTGTSLSEASKWVVARVSELTKQELSFIETSRKADEQVRQEAAETLASPAVQRRVRNADWEEKQRLENRVRQLETLSRGSMLRRLSAATVGIVILIIAGYWLWSHLSKTNVSGQGQSIGSSQQASTGTANQVVSIDQQLQTGARRKEANTLLSLGVVNSYEAAAKLDPLQGVLGIDKVLATRTKDGHFGPASQFAQAARIDYLRSSEPLLDSSPELRKYICAHNSFVIVASEKVAHAAAGLKYWREKFPLAEIGPASANNPDWVPIITDFFLTCSEAMQKAIAIQQEYGAKYGSTPSQGLYSLPDCPPCSSQVAPPPQSKLAK